MEFPHFHFFELINSLFMLKSSNELFNMKLIFF